MSVPTSVVTLLVFSLLYSKHHLICIVLLVVLDDIVLIYLLEYCISILDIQNVLIYLLVFLRLYLQIIGYIFQYDIIIGSVCLLYRISLSHDNCLLLPLLSSLCSLSFLLCHCLEKGL